MKWGLLISIIALCTSGFMAAVYEVIANRNLLPIGNLFRLNSVMPVVGGFIVFGSTMTAIILNPWWTGIVVLILALVFSQIIIQMFKQASQIVILISMTTGLVFTISFIWNSNYQ